MHHESATIALWHRLYAVIGDRISAQKFSRDETLNGAIKTRLRQYLINAMFSSIRMYSRHYPAIHGYDGDKLDKCLQPDFSIRIKGEVFKPGRNLGKEYIHFWAQWILCLLALVNIFTAKRIRHDATGSILYGSAENTMEQSKQLNNAAAFLDDTPMDGVQTSQSYVFKGSPFWKSVQPGMAIGQSPEFIFITWCRLSVSQRLHALALHFIGLLTAHALCLRHPFLAGFISEFASFKIMRFLDDRGYVGGIVFSTSNAIRQPLIARMEGKAKIHHIYYNVAPINPTLKTDPQPELAMLDDHLLGTDTGTKWVWTEADAHVYKHHYKHEHVRCCGIPSLFYTMDNIPEAASPRAYDIVIFDVTPFADSFIDSHNLTFYYGRYETAIALVRHTLELIMQLSSKNQTAPLRVALKPKRRHPIRHDMRYWNDLDELETRYAGFSVLPPEQNIFELFHPETVFVSRPYTSPAQMASILGATSIYYDPTETLADMGIKRDNLFFASGRDQLQTLLEKQPSFRPTQP